MQEIRRLLDEAYQALSAHEGQKALDLYEELIRLAPGEPAAYIGKANAMLTACDSVQYADLFAPVLQAAKLTPSPEYREDLIRLVNFGTPPHQSTLLIHSGTYKRYEVTKCLVDMGANIHIRTTAGTTALWYVAFKPLPSDRISDGRKIAKLLIDMGAEIDVKNLNGVALFNENTDPDIARMIRRRNRDAQRGTAGKLTEDDPKPPMRVKMGTVLGISGFAVGMVASTLFQMATIGCVIISLVLAAAGYILGTLIDENREQDGPMSGAVKLFAIFIAVILAGCLLCSACGSGFALSGSSGGSYESSVTCPRCGTSYRSSHPASQYVSASGCTQCK